MAHLPTLMIFDDHDVTDDWNLTADWEETAYGHPFSRRIIGNALMGYLLCQAGAMIRTGWPTPWKRSRRYSTPPRAKTAGCPPSRTMSSCAICSASRAGNIRFPVLPGWWCWIPGPAAGAANASWGAHPLMDWEALSDLQQQILDAPSVVIVSPTPMFGVKLIEVVQKLFTLAGKPLLVDAENWMAHRGAASVMLNIFRHSRTPGHYVVLSGDVHYSFAYDIELRHRQHGSKIWQITSSGVKNAFPDTLLDAFDRANRWLYAPRSPLNWFTKRRPMRIRPRDPDRAEAGERLWNGAGIGLVVLDEQGRPRKYANSMLGLRCRFSAPSSGK